MNKTIGIVFFLIFINLNIKAQQGTNKNMMNMIAYSISHGIIIPPSSEIDSFLTQLRHKESLRYELENRITADGKKRNLELVLIDHESYIQYLLRNGLCGFSYQLYLTYDTTVLTVGGRTNEVSSIDYVNSSLTEKDWSVPDSIPETMTIRDNEEDFIKYSECLAWLITYDLSIPKALSFHISFDIQNQKYQTMLVDILKKENLNVKNNNKELTVSNGLRKYSIIKSGTPQDPIEVIPKWEY